MSANQEDVFNSYDPQQDDPSQIDYGDQPDPGEMDTTEYDQSQSAPVGALSANPALLSQSQSRLSVLDKAYGQTQKESAALYQRQQDILDKAMQRLMGEKAGPSQQEIYMNLASAMMAPTKTGNFGETMSNVTGVGADLMTARRKAQDAQREMIDKYGLEGTDIGLKRVDANSRQLLAQMERERTRAYDLSKASAPRSLAMLPGFTLDEKTGLYRAGNGKLYTPEQYQALMHPSRSTPKTGPLIENGTELTPETADDYFKMVAWYDTPAPNSRQLKAMGAVDANGDPSLPVFYARVKKFNPNYDARNYTSSQRALIAFGSGAQGNTVRSFNVTTDHLDTFYNAAQALKNGQIPIFNEMAAQIAEKTGQPAPVGFDAVKTIVADELAKAIIGGQMAVEDRREFAKNVKRSQSPAQMLEVFNRYGSLMGGQIRGLKKQYEGSALKNDFEERWLEEPARKWLYIRPDGTFRKSKSEGQDPGATSPAPAAPAAGGTPSVSAKPGADGKPAPVPQSISELQRLHDTTTDAYLKVLLEEKIARMRAKGAK
jgi:hypothetical protein